MVKQDEIIPIAQRIVRGDYINFGSKPFLETSAVYRFTNEDINSYYQHVENKDKIRTVIGSGDQVINSILAGCRDIDCFDISVFPEYTLYLRLAAIMELNKDEFLAYYLSDDRRVLFGDDLYDKVRNSLPLKYKDFWDSLYNFDDGYDIYNSLLFRSDSYNLRSIIEYNPYLQGDNYDRLKEILLSEDIKINPSVMDITSKKIEDKYDLINLSNILSYNILLPVYVDFLRSNFNVSEGEIINYFFSLLPENERKLKDLLGDEGYIE